MWNFALMPRVGLCCLMVLYGVCIQVIPCAYAETTDLTTMRNEARALFKRGQYQASQKQYKQALSSFRKALRLAREIGRNQPKPQMLRRLHLIEVTLLFVLGRTYEFDRQYGNAAKYYQWCLQRKPPEAIRQKATAFLAALQPRLQVLLSFQSVPSGALVLIRTAQSEGRFGKTPFQIRVKPGQYQIQVQMQGYQTIQETVEAVAGETVTREFQLQPSRGAPNPTRDGSVSSTDPTNPSLSAKPPKPTNVPRILAWSGLATAALMAIAGTILVGVAQAEFGDVTRKIGQPFGSLEALRVQRDRGVNLQNTGFVFWGLMLAAGGVSVWGFLSQPKPPKDAVALSKNQ